MICNYRANIFNHYSIFLMNVEGAMMSLVASSLLLCRKLKSSQDYIILSSQSNTPVTYVYISKICSVSSREAFIFSLKTKLRDIYLYRRDSWHFMSYGNNVALGTKFSISGFVRTLLYYRTIIVMIDSHNPGMS